MNSKERIFSVLNSQQPDRIPNTNILMTLIAKEIGVPYKQFCLDAKTKVDGGIYCAEKFGIDVVTTMSDPMTEAYDIGTDTAFPEDGVPFANVNLLQEKSTLKKLSVVKPENGKRMSVNLEVIRRYKESVGNDFPIVGWVEGCFAESADLRGVTEFLMDPFEEDDFFSDLLDFTLEQAILFAKAQVEAGADIIGVGDAIASVAGPGLYKQYAGPYERKLLKAIKDMGVKTKLHICGNIEPFLNQLPVEYIDILDVDWMVPLERVLEDVSSDVTISGNYNPVAVMQDMTKEGVISEVQKCAFIMKGRKYFTAAGCEIPKATPKENLLSVNEALKGIQTL